jgi:DNA-binding MarR family transcriptional regulator
MSGEQGAVESDPADEGQAARIASDWAKLRPDIDERALAIGLRISRLSILGAEQFDRLGAPWGITGFDAAILMRLRRAAGDVQVRPTDLGKMFHLSPGAVTYRIKRLTQAGLVERAGDPGDGRAALLHLTAAGVEAIDAVVTAHTAAALERLRALDAIPGGREMLGELLERLVAAWEAG